ncbi:DMT family transporter [Dinoroseobacter sp. S375]|uniref:DMT family transporter n=1 Tax=Dinoroseobacter sp. S375 TaxID=3415136 RepID=UPI003C7AE70E
MFQDLRPALILVLASLLWAGNFVAARAVHALSDPVWLNAARWSLAALCLAPVLWRDRVAVHAALRRDLARLCGLALLGVIGTNTVLYAGLEHASAKQAGVIYAVSPLMILGLSWALGRAGLCGGTVLGSGLAFGGAVLAVVVLDERPTQWQVAGMVCALAGVALAAQPGLGSARDPCQKAGAKEGSPHAPRDHHPQDR